MSPSDPGPGPVPGPDPDPAAPPPDEPLPAVAPQLRELRRRAGLTLEAAAHTAGLSPAHLSRLETGHRQPSLPLLLALARAYGTTVSELLGPDHGVPADRDAVVRAADAAPGRTGGWTYRPAGAPGRGMQALRLSIPYGAQSDVVRVHPGEEWLYALTGRLRLRLGDSEHVLAPGDSAHFDSLTPHRLAAVDAAGAELLFVHTLLQSPAGALCLGTPRGRTPGGPHA